jgi:putative membrane protein
MKLKFSINTRVLLGLVAAGSIVLSGTALAQNPRLYPPVKSNSSPPAESKSNSDSKAKGDKLSSGDKAFMKDAAEGGMMEVAMGRVAEKNASDSQVKNFGAQMVKDHGKANNELKALAKQENVELPAEKEAGKWKSDKDYMDMMVKDHEKDVAAFEKQAKEGNDPDVKAFASKTAKVVRKHLDMAKEIDGKLK